jgi:hypothetical protein
VLTGADGAATEQKRPESDAVTNNLSAVVTGGAASAPDPPVTSPPAGAICRCGKSGGDQQRLRSSLSKSKLVDEADELDSDAAAKRRETEIVVAVTEEHNYP